MDKKRIFSSMFFVIILLIGAYFVNAIQGNLVDGDVRISAPLNNTIINGTNYTFLITIASPNSTNMTNWTIQRGAKTFVLGEDIGGAFNSTNLTNNTQIWPIGTMDGVYNLTVNASNGTGFLGNTTAVWSVWNITFDTQPPLFYDNASAAFTQLAGSSAAYWTQVLGTGAGKILTINGTIGNNSDLKNNATVQFSYAVIDRAAELAFGCNLTIDGVVKNNSIVTNGTRIYMNVTDLKYGWHSFNYTCMDQAGYKNTSYTMKFHLNDTVAPTGVGLTLSATSISKGASATLTCGASDVMDTDLTYTIHYKHKTISDEGYISSTGAYTFTPSEAGIYDIDCRAQDDASLSSAYTTAQTLTVNNPSSSGSSGGGSSGSSSTALPTIEVNIPAGETREVGNLDAAAGAAVAMSSGSTATFTVSGGSHSAVIKSITETSVVVTISSTPIDVELTIGETKEVDVDADTKNDLSVTLESIISGVANLKFTSLTITVPETTPTTPTTPTAPTTEAGTSLTWLWIVLVIIIIGAGVYFFMKKK